MWPSLVKIIQSLPLAITTIEQAKRLIDVVRQWAKKRREAAHVDALKALSKADTKDQIKDAIKDISKNG